MFTEKSVAEFLDALASSDPTPGGGSGAALGGALGAALVSMVCNLTIGKKGYEDVQDELESLLEETEGLRAELTELLEKDTQVYNKVMAAYRMPRNTDEEKEERRQAMQAALRDATEVPLSIAEDCARVVALAMPAARKGNKWAVSDAGVGALLAEASIHAALLNVYINLASIEDSDYVEGIEKRIEEITAGKSQEKDRVMSVVREAIGS